jgi:hypothetical protein
MKLLKFERPPAPESAPNQDAVKIARELLALCESGECRNVVIVGILSDDSIVDGWSRSDEGMRPYMVLGAIEKLKIEFASKEIETR